MSLDQLVGTGLFSTTQGKVQREYVPFNEALTAQAFAHAINTGKMQVEDAWRYYWTYEEDAKFWGLPQDKEWRAMLPAWYGVLRFVMPACEIALKYVGRQVQAGCKAGRGIRFGNLYHPYLDDLIFLIRPYKRNSTPEGPASVNIEEEYDLLMHPDPLARLSHPRWPEDVRTYLSENASDTIWPYWARDLKNADSKPDPMPEFELFWTAHRALKPKGYNPAVKKLVIPDVA